MVFLTALLMGIQPVVSDEWKCTAKVARKNAIVAYAGKRYS